MYATFVPDMSIVKASFVRRVGGAFSSLRETSRAKMIGIGEGGL